MTTRPFAVTCGTFATVLPDRPSVVFGETALHPDGLRLIGDDGGGIQSEAARPTSTAPFGAPGPVTALGRYIRDPTFATINGGIVAFGHALVSPRHLVLCREPASTTPCEDITVTDETQAVITDDHDGPNVAIRDGELVMSFNRTREFYLARPASTDLLSWSATRIDVGVMGDDPAMIADGQVLIVAEALPTGGERLNALRWDSTLEAFVDRHTVDAPGGSPAIGVQQGNTFELFVTAAPRGVFEPMVATCTISM